MANEVCSVAGCERPIKARGWCSKHYNEWSETQQPACIVADCNRPALARGCCGQHYQILHKRGDPNAKIGKGYRVGGRTRAESEALRELGLWVCQGCSRTLPKDEFHYLKKGPNAGKVNTACKLCCRLARHHVTYAWYQATLAAQSETCAVLSCDNFPAVIDHDHSCCPGETSCGRCVRGLLCANCNSGLGYFRDIPELLEGAALYLRECTPLLSAA